MSDENAQLQAKAQGYLMGAAVSAMVYLGDALGLYEALRGGGPMSSAALAAKKGLAERWVREWLLAQAGAGLVALRGDGQFELTLAQSSLLTDGSDASAAGSFQMIVSLIKQVDRLRACFRTGRGVPYEDLGEEHAKAEARLSALGARKRLLREVLSLSQGAVAQLESGARVAELGCGAGLGLFQLAEAYPKSHFCGFDTSATAIKLARQELSRTRLTNVSFEERGAEALDSGGPFDLALTIGCLHDMARPDARCDCLPLTDPGLAAFEIRR
jgi:hypothetical protein